MRSKTIDVILFLLIVIIFISYFSIRSQVFTRYNFPGELLNIEECITNKKWNEANLKAIKLEETWEKLVPFIALNYGEEDFSRMEDAISRIIKSTENKNASEALSNTMIAEKLWENFKKFLPIP